MIIKRSLNGRATDEEGATISEAMSVIELADFSDQELSSAAFRAQVSLDLSTVQVSSSEHSNRAPIVPILRTRTKSKIQGSSYPPAKEPTDLAFSGKSSMNPSTFLRSTSQRVSISPTRADPLEVMTSAMQVTDHDKLHGNTVDVDLGLQANKNDENFLNNALDAAIIQNSLADRSDEHQSHSDQSTLIKPAIVAIGPEKNNNLDAAMSEENFIEQAADTTAGILNLHISHERKESALPSSSYNHPMTPKRSAPLINFRSPRSARASTGGRPPKETTLPPWASVSTSKRRVATHDFLSTSQITAARFDSDQHISKHPSDGRTPTDFADMVATIDPAETLAVPLDEYPDLQTKSPKEQPGCPPKELQFESGSNFLQNLEASHISAHIIDLTNSDDEKLPQNNVTAPPFRANLKWKTSKLAHSSTGMSKNGELEIEEVWHFYSQLFDIDSSCNIQDFEFVPASPRYAGENTSVAPETDAMNTDPVAQLDLHYPTVGSFTT